MRSRRNTKATAPVWVTKEDINSIAVGAVVGSDGNIILLLDNDVPLIREIFLRSIVPLWGDGYEVIDPTEESVEYLDDSETLSVCTNIPYEDWKTFGITMGVGVIDDYIDCDQEEDVF